ncbi:MAG: ribosome-associated translation inhibitor RaiA [Victivallaceae bacterium]|jgi:putative sigma-54 modulation protein|nr:ribosome-associated translation inhibitor RaiA [Victivallaceae bacterium]NLK82790.1 ribosome-associated translation inhibitor RaiA [Lentisphaerota bacterium]MDD3117321.1 ribosome-associated translation inhibitor RaiA [Victivallaceae bacterium]MDD3704138.1 ribosome-associated translation inhibitor RaiA [Victivallaceae bacterium]MDD4317406.1 ribosome-associated translation inhibitor RaiA [Victivallaceae bacterium]
MKIIISGRNLTVSDALKGHIEKKLGGVLDHQNLKVTSARVVLEVEKIRNLAEINVALKNHIFDAKAESLVNMSEAVDDAIGKIEVQVNKLIDKVQDHGQKVPLRDIISAEEPESDF